MIHDVGRPIGLSFAFGVLVAAYLSVAAPVLADDADPEAAHNAATSQAQTGVTGQAATTMGVQTLGGAAGDGNPNASKGN